MVVTTGQSEMQYIGRIPIRNLWILMFYASDMFKVLGNKAVGIEENPDDLPRLVAELLAHSVEKRLRRQLGFGYRSKEAVLNRVRGRIDVLKIERHQLMDHGRVACRYEELTVDTLRNRYVCGGLELISKILGRTELSRRCRILAGSLKAMGVSGKVPSRAEMSMDRFGRHDVDDWSMVAAAKLAFELSLPLESACSYLLASPNREETWVRKLFEKAVLGFYSVMGWTAEGGKKLSWPIETKTSGIDSFFPAMKTDIVLNNKKTETRIVIDTKFTSVLTAGWYRDESFRSGYIYQMYAYLRSQVGQGDSMADHASGLLLHPSIGYMLNESVSIQGHRLTISTIDLTLSASEIRQQLLGLISELTL